MRAILLLACALLLASEASAQWDNSNFDYRTAVTLTEPAGVARTKDHVRFTVNLQEGREEAAGGAVMYCGGTQVPMESVALQSSNGWVTQLQAVAEVDFAASEVKNCYVYYNPVGGSQTALTRTGWESAGLTNAQGCDAYTEISPGTASCYTHYNAINYCGSDITICGASDYMKLNAWCYFKAPSTANEQFMVCSDDGAVLNIEGSDVVSDNSCHSPRWSSAGYYSTTAGRFYAMKVYYAEQGGNARIQPAYGASSNSIDTECYGFYGDEWTVTTSVGSEESRNKEPTITGNNISPDSGGWYDEFTYTVNYNDPDNDDVNCAFEIKKADAEWASIGSSSGVGSCSLKQQPFTCLDSDKSMQWRVNYDDGHAHTGTWGPWNGPTVSGACCNNPLTFTYAMTYTGTPMHGLLTFDQGNWIEADYHCFSIDGSLLGSYTSYPADGITVTDTNLLSSGNHNLVVALSATGACNPDSLNQWNVTNINLQLTYYS